MTTDYGEERLQALRDILATDEEKVRAIHRLMRNTRILQAVCWALWGLSFWRYFTFPPPPWWYCTSHAWLTAATAMLFYVAFKQPKILEAWIKIREHTRQLLRSVEMAEQIRKDHE